MSRTSLTRVAATAAAFALVTGLVGAVAPSAQARTPKGSTAGSTHGVVGVSPVHLRPGDWWWATPT
jgi:hypothetical protein